MTNKRRRKHNSCHCGAPLEYDEERFAKLCWCCAAERGYDIGATFYYTTGIWQRPKRKHFKRKEIRK